MPGHASPDVANQFRRDVNLRAGHVRDTHVSANPATKPVVKQAPPHSEPEPPLFDEWYHRNFRPVVALVYSLSGSRGAAEELAQDAFLEAHRRWDSISEYESPDGWVRHVAMNKARSRLRRRAAEARAYAKHVGRDRALPAEMPEFAQEFWRAVRDLPTRQAQSVALHYLDDLPVEGIAEILGVSEGTVKTHLHRARRTLANQLKQEEQ